MPTKYLCRSISLYILLLVAVASGSVRVLLPFVAASYQDKIQDAASLLIGTDVQIGRLTAAVNGFGMRVVLHDVEIATAKASPFALRQIYLDISLARFFTSSILAASDITIVGAALTILRKQDGTFAIDEFSGNPTSKPYWLLEVASWTLLDTSIAWQDLYQNTQPITISHLDLSLRNSSRETRELHLLGQMPGEAKNSLRLSAILHGDILAGNAISGVAYGTAQKLNLNHFNPYLPKNFAVLSGLLSFKQWLTITKSTVSDGQGDWQIHQLGTSQSSKTNLPKNLSKTIKQNQPNARQGSKHANLFVPQLFRWPIEIKQLGGKITWQENADNWLVSAKNFRFDGTDLTTSHTFAVAIPKNNGSIIVDATTDFAVPHDIRHIKKYYPINLLDDDTVRWLDNAFVAGFIPHGNMRLHGAIDQFPFSHGEGLFEVRFLCQDLQLHYDEDWPDVRNITADVLQTADTIKADVLSGEMGGLAVLPTQLSLDSFGSQNLTIRGKIGGKIITGLQFLQQTPLRETARGVLAAITPTGASELELNMRIPLGDEDSSIEARLPLQNHNLTVNAISLAIGGITGDLLFTENGLFSKKITGNTLGFPLSMTANSDEHRSTIEINGSTSLAHLRQQFAFFASPLMKKLALRGNSHYQVRIDLPGAQPKLPSLTVVSNLQGIAIGLPKPLQKSASESRDFTLSMELHDLPTLDLTLSYGEDLRVEIDLDKKRDELVAAYIRYGLAGVYNPPKQGIKIQVVRHSFDLSKWQAFAKSGALPLPTMPLRQIDINTDNLHWNGQNYGMAGLEFYNGKEHWQGNIQSAIGGGTVTIAKSGENISLDFDYLNLDKLSAVSSATNTTTAAGIPLFELTAKSVLWKGSDFGRLSLHNKRTKDGMEFQHYIISSKHYLDLTAQWTKNNSSWAGTISTDDFGDFLRKVQIKNDFEETTAQVDFLANWQGSPYQLPLTTMQASVDALLKNGRLTSVEPGLGRILGLLAIGQWSKRLLLDFGDVYKKGLSFNSIDGYFAIADGKAITQDLQVDAIPAHIFVKGSSDLGKKTHQHYIHVVPKSADAIPIAGGILAGIAELTSKILIKDFETGLLFDSKYTASGAWDDIKIVKITDENGVLDKIGSKFSDFFRDTKNPAGKTTTP